MQLWLLSYNNMSIIALLGTNAPYEQKRGTWKWYLGKVTAIQGHPVLSSPLFPCKFTVPRVCNGIKGGGLKSPSLGRWLPELFWAYNVKLSKEADPSQPYSLNGSHLLVWMRCLHFSDRALSRLEFTFLHRKQKFTFESKNEKSN